MGQGACTCIGNSLGANNPKLARRFLSVLSKLSAAISIIQVIFNISLRHTLTNLLVEDDHIAKVTANILILQQILGIFDLG